MPAPVIELNGTPMTKTAIPDGTASTRVSKDTILEHLRIRYARDIASLAEENAQLTAALATIHAGFEATISREIGTRDMALRDLRAERDELASKVAALTSILYDKSKP